MTPIELAALQAQSRTEAMATLNRLEMYQLKAIMKSFKLAVWGSRDALISCIILRTHPAKKQPCGCPEPTVVQEGF